LTNFQFHTYPGLPAFSLNFPSHSSFSRETLGVLDIQSERLEVFNTDDIAALQLLSLQIAVAVRMPKFIPRCCTSNRWSGSQHS